MECFIEFVFLKGTSFVDSLSSAVKSILDANEREYNLLQRVIYK